MKFVKFALAAVAALFISQAADAQLYLTGGFGLSHSGGKSEAGSVTVDRDPENTCSFTPEIGYYFSDGLAFGAEVALEHYKKKDADNKDYWYARNTCSFNPFFRWDFISGNDFSLGLKARVLLGFGKEKDQDNDHSKLSHFGFSIVPVAQYNFNSHWGMYATMGNLYFLHEVEKSPKNDDVKDIDNTLNATVNLASLRLGIVYTF